jgi:hypothetical protein
MIVIGTTRLKVSTSTSEMWRWLFDVQDEKVTSKQISSCPRFPSSIAQPLLPQPLPQALTLGQKSSGNSALRNARDSDSATFHAAGRSAIDPLLTGL